MVIIDHQRILKVGHVMPLRTLVILHFFDSAPSSQSVCEIWREYLMKGLINPIEVIVNLQRDC